MDVRWGLKHSLEWNKRIGLDDTAQPIYESRASVIAGRFRRATARVRNSDGVEVTSSAHCITLEPVGVGDKIGFRGREYVVIAQEDALGIYDTEPSFYKVYF